MTNHLPASSLTSEEKTWAAGLHASALFGWLFPGAFVVVPLVIWLTKRESSTFVKTQGINALNFQIAFFVLSYFGEWIFGELGRIAVTRIGFESSAPFLGGHSLGLNLSGLVRLGYKIFISVYAIQAAIKASKGQDGIYPVNVPLIR